MPVLITAGLSPEAYRLERILKEAGERNQDVRTVVFADVSSLPQFPGRTSLILPPYDAASFVHETLKACLDHQINRLFPLKRGEVLELAKARDLFAEYGVTLMIPSDEWINNNQYKEAERGADICVLELGMLVAGQAVQDELLLNNETGVFCRATKEQKTEYSLYLVNDAGI